MSFDAKSAVVFPIARGLATDAPVALVGGKARNLMRMSALGMRVPPGFVLGTDFCDAFLDQGEARIEGMSGILSRELERLSERTGRRFGDRRRPLLVSVRSGAACSMPGMMDTILDVGLSEATLPGLIRSSGNPRLAWDAYRRLVQNFAEVVHGRPATSFAREVDRIVAEQGVESVRDLDSRGHKNLLGATLERFQAEVGSPFPEDPMEQLEQAVYAVFRSWRSARAEEFRRLHSLSGRGGTAATIQSMVFGNAGGTSGSGVAFTRDPTTGENRLYMDFLFNAQGEDVVSGRFPTTSAAELERVLPSVYRELAEVRRILERELRDVQDFEFTVEEGTLYLLQTRTAKRTPWALLCTVVDQVQEGLLQPAEALERLAAIDLTELKRVRIVDDGSPALCRAVPAGMGVASGRVAFDPERAIAIKQAGEDVVLVRNDVATNDLEAMAVSAGILTARGGRTSHAAVVARELDKVCLVGCSALRISDGTRTARIGKTTLHEGDVISLDGDSGNVYLGKVETTVERPEREIALIEGWRGIASHP